MTTTTRILPVLVLAAAAAGPAAGQYRPEVPDPAYPARRPAPDPGFPPGRPAAAADPTALDRVTAPVGPAPGEYPDPYAALTTRPAPPAAAGLPPGAYPSPYYTDGPGCCGPLGRNGRVGYELYTYTGPSFILGDGLFGAVLNTGWSVGGGGRSLFFNRTHDAAWVVDLGLSYQFNPGNRNDLLDLFVRQAPVQNPITGQVTEVPDTLNRVGVRGLHRTNFNFGLGRDFWSRGPGSTGLEAAWNVRCGALLGGRWGTSHVDLIPQADPVNGYFRRQNVTHGIFLAAHTTVEVPLGAWILFGGLRGEYGYEWTNLVPPIQGNIHSYQLLMTAGIRF